MSQTNKDQKPGPQYAAQGSSPDGLAPAYHLRCRAFCEWLRCEAARLAKAGIATEVIGPNQYGEVCLRRKEAPLCNAM